MLRHRERIYSDLLLFMNNLNWWWQLSSSPPPPVDGKSPPSPPWSLNSTFTSLNGSAGVWGRQTHMCMYVSHPCSSCEIAVWKMQVVPKGSLSSTCRAKLWHFLNASNYKKKCNQNLWMIYADRNVTCIWCGVCGFSVRAVSVIINAQSIASVLWDEYRGY